MIQLLLDALRENDTPERSHGIALLYRFMSARSSAARQPLENFLSYIPRSPYAALLGWEAVEYKGKMDFSADLGGSGEDTKARQVMRLKPRGADKWTKVSWTLSLDPSDDTWRVDNVLVSPSSRR